MTPVMQGSVKKACEEPLRPRKGFSAGSNPLSKLAGGSGCSGVGVLRFHFCSASAYSASCRCNGGGHARVQGRGASCDSSGGKNISRHRLRSGESSGFRSNAWVRKFHAANYGVKTHVVPPRGVSGAAGFCMLQLRVQEGAAAPTLPITLPEPVAKSLLDVGDVVMRRQDTSRTGVQVEKPSAGDFSMTQVLDSW